MLFGPGIGKSGWIVTWYRGVTMTSIPGAAGMRCRLAKSTSACDTPGMATLSRAFRRWDPIRVAAVFLGLAMLSLLTAYGYAAYNVQPTIGTIAAAVALVGIAGSGLLYAWRLGAGGIVD
jgi:hypothetical protein